MTLSPGALVTDFLPAFLAGMAVNFEIATLALVAGLAVGLPLAAAAAASRLVRVPAALIIALMRAAPTFVVMFVLLSVLPRDALASAGLTVTGRLTVALALLPYAAAYIADNGGEALAQWRKGSRLAALLFLPNVARAYFILVMASSAGAAIGVTEGISIILRYAEDVPLLADKLALFGLGILLFGIPLQCAFLGLNVLRARLTRCALAQPAR